MQPPLLIQTGFSGFFLLVVASLAFLGGAVIANWDIRSRYHLILKTQLDEPGKGVNVASSIPAIPSPKRGDDEREAAGRLNVRQSLLDDDPFIINGLLHRKHQGLTGRLQWLLDEKRYLLQFETDFLDRARTTRYRISVVFDPEKSLSDLAPLGLQSDMPFGNGQLTFVQEQIKKVENQIRR